MKNSAYQGEWLDFYLLKPRPGWVIIHKFYLIACRYIGSVIHMVKTYYVRKG